MILHLKKITEVEQFVFQDRSANVAAEVVVCKVPDRRVKEATRVQVAILKELIR